MNLDEQKDPGQKDVKFILSLFNSKKFVDAKKEIDKQIIKFPNSSILLQLVYILPIFKTVPM